MGQAYAMAVYQQKSKGTDVWYCDFVWVTSDGIKKRVRRPCRDEKQRPAKSRTAAEAFEHRIRAQLASGTFELTRSKPEVDKTQGLTFEAFRERYFEDHVAKLKASSQAAHETIWRLHLLPLLGTVLVQDITEAHLAKVQAHMRGLGRGPKTLNTVMSALRTALVLAHEWGLRGAAPKVRWDKLPDVPIEWFDEGQVEKLVLTKDPMVTVAVKTGLRIGEMLSLRWSDVDLMRGEVTVQRSVFWSKNVPHEGATKTGRIRVVPLPASALAATKEHKPKAAEPDDYVFVSQQGKPLTRNEAKWVLWRACDSACLPRCGWHRLRHSYISALVRANIPLPQVQRLAGHARIEQTLRYTHVSNSELHEAVSRLT